MKLSGVHSNDIMETLSDIFFVAISFCLILGCHASSDEPIQHLILLDDLPTSMKANFPLVLNIRSDYKGVVEFQESPKFQVLLNITAPSVGDAYMVHHEVVPSKGELLLQVYKAPLSPWIPYITLQRIAMVILVLVVIVLLLCLLVAMWWYKTRRISEDMYKDRGLDDSAQQQPLMYRSRNSMQLATQSGDMLLGSGDDEPRNDDVLHNLPEVPEDDGDEIPLEKLKRSPKKHLIPLEEKGLSSDEDDLKKRMKQPSQFDSPRKRKPENVQRFKKRSGQTYNEDCVDYSDQSSEMSHPDDLEHLSANQKKFDKKQDGASQKMTTFHPPIGRNTLQKSDGELYNTDNLRRYENIRSLPNSISGLISPNDERKGFLSSHNDTISTDVQMNSDNIKNERRLHPQLARAKAFDNQTYGSANQRGRLQNPIRKGTDYIYVNDVPPSYASHSDYPVHNDSIGLSNKLRPSFPNKDNIPPSPSLSNKDGSYLSDSGQSTSIADSSDVFEENAPRSMFHDTDSDVEIPPLDFDDFPSSYIPESLRLQQKLAGESPEKKAKKPSMMVIPRVISKDPSSQNAPKLVTFQQPASSPEHRNESSRTGSLVHDNKTSSGPSHKPSNTGINEYKSASLEHRYNKPSLINPVAPSNATGSSTAPQTSTGGGNRGSLAMKNIHVAIACSFCLMGLITGVVSQLLNETEVKIIVFAPRGFLSNGSAVFFNKQRPGEVRSENIQSNILWYEVPSARLVNVNSTLCQDNLCSQGCDANTGQCLCWKGFTLSGDYDCVDVDECYEGSAQCSPYASCQDTKGSYRCICGNSYYGDGINCEACSTPCKEGTFEVQPCAVETKQQKICKACTESCNEGFYLYRKCTPSQDAICRMCHPQCSPEEFEYTVCSNNQTRQCREKMSMPQAETSSNVLLEDLTEVKGHTIEIKDDEKFDITQNNTFNIFRGSNLTVTVNIKELRVRPQLKPVNFNDKVSASIFPGLPKILSDYCPHPLPRYYKMSSKLYKDVIYKVGESCSHGNCRQEPKPCQTFRSYGNFPNLQRRYGDFTLVCMESGPLSHLFGINQQLTAATSYYAEKTDSCHKRISECDDCTRGCALKVSQDKGDCEVKGDDGDNGWSPRLQACYSCCAEPRCMEVCRNYSLSGCSPEMCHKGSFVEFKLNPIYSKAASEFYCNVRPIKNQLLVKFEYSVDHKGQPLNTKSISLFADDDWISSGHMKKRDGFLDFEVESYVTSLPDVISGDITTPAYTAGTYRDSGSSFTQTSQSNVYIHPRSPFAITPSMWEQTTCSDDLLSKGFKTIKRDLPYNKLPQFNVKVEGRRIFSVANHLASPQLRLTIDRQMSVFSTIYNQTVVSYETLKGSITHDNSQWIISVEGHVTACPGVLSVNISDSNYKEEPLFMYDLLIRCPRSFRLISRLPTADHRSVSRDFTVSVKDANRTILLMLHRPEMVAMETPVTKNKRETTDEDQTDKVSDGKEDDGMSDFPFSVPFIAAVCGAIVLLLFMAGFGIFITPGEPNTDEVSHFQIHHLLFAVTYFTFQFLYCLVISLSTFVLIWVALNSESVTFIQQFHHQTALQKALNSLELAKMQSHLIVEMKRLGEEANVTKSTCDIKIRKIVSAFEEEKKVLSLTTTPDLWNELNNKITSHTKTVLAEFTEQLTRSRTNYNYYANYLMEKMVFDIQQSYVSLESSRWLDGAKFMHGTVRNVRTLLKRQDTRPFMEWMGLESSFSQYAVGIDLSMPMPPLPNPKDFAPGAETYLPPASEGMTSSHVAVPPVVHVYNLWFNGETDVNMAPVYRTVKNNFTDDASSNNHMDFKTEIIIFLALMVFIDIMWLIHRTVKASRVSRLLLCGYPLYLDCSENKGETSSERAQYCPLVTCCTTQKENPVRRLLTKTLSSLFIPKLVAMVMVCLMVYVTMVISSKLVRKETLATIGYYNDVENLLVLNQRMVNGRLKANAERINSVEYPVYQDLLNMYIQRHLVLLEMIRKQHINDNITTDEAGLPPFINDLHCHFPKIEARLYQRAKHSEDMLIDRHADPLLQAVRKLITDSCFLILLYLAVVALKQLLSMVIWLYVKRAGLIHLWIIYETNADEIRVQER